MTRRLEGIWHDFLVAVLFGTARALAILVLMRVGAWFWLGR